MSGRALDRGWWRRASARARDLVFGDRIGLALFLGSVCFAALYWRADVFITDTATMSRTLSALSEGRLWIEPATGDHFDAPGAVVSDGLVYGRNYGQAALALPVLWVLQALSAVTDLAVALVAAWHLALLALALTLGRIYGRERLARLAGSALVSASFLANLALARPLDVSLSLLALQVSTLAAAGLCGVMVYRLLARQHDRRLGALAGAAVVLVSPVGFWATIPKRHVLVTALCLTILYLFARSRTPSGRAFPVIGSVPERRALLYVCVALLAWIHAAEGLLVFLAVVAFDVPTAPRNDRRTVAALAVVFGLAMVPLLVTNLLVTGHPVRPPRTLYNTRLPVDAVQIRQESGASGGSRGAPDGSSGGGATTSSGSAGGLVETVTGLGGLLPFDAVRYVASFVIAILVDGVTALFDVGDLYRTFVRSDPLSIGGEPRFRGANLSVLESMPLLAAVAGAVATAGRSALAGSWDRLRDVTATDGLAGVLCVVFVLMYVGRLPFAVQITVRYLLPVYPLALYLIARSSVVRTLVSTSLRPLLWTYAGGVLIGTQLLVVYVAVRGLAVAEATRVHAVVSVVAAALLAVTLAGSAFDERFRTPAAVALGLAAAAGTAFLLLAGLSYFGFLGNYVLPVSGAVSDLLAIE